MKLIKRLAFLGMLAIIGAIGLHAYARASLDGAFIKWKSIGAPPQKAVKIIAPHYVQVQSGQIYKDVFSAECPEGCWILSEKPIQYPQEELPLSTCGYLPNVEEFESSAAFCQQWGPGTLLTVQGIDKDGIVLSWSRSYGESNEIVLFFAPYAGALGGALIGLIALLPVTFSDLLKWMSKRSQAKRAA